ncbi:putative LRR receptor-like serine/threonine-protein kinase [Heracleum sosnowskyi]|uniref:LRR receptor-like serine/threonine-protein kinase n=1 Tax=Heracleum sosnowskyi TaxID=360622 RepID=A0AAD8HYH5_9APIA|nr:putative LRR receptor-like serine/threonine-protein kinase [Heracleum sosnowskyi]
MASFYTLQLVCVCLGLFLVACNGFASHEVYALSAFKEAIYEDPLMVLSNWNSLDSDPCDWSGISCSTARDHILKINVSQSSLKGFIATELDQLSFLQELIIHGNSFIGTIPKELGTLKFLRVLDLGGNMLSGPIPLEIGNLTSIVKINLGSNGLTGRLPLELGNLNNLEELRLDRNKLEGTIPGSNGSQIASNLNGLSLSNGNPTGLCRASQLRVADFSYNFFVGSVPKCLEYLQSSSFQGNCRLDRDPKQRDAPLCDGTLAKGHPGLGPKHRYVEDRSEHQSASKPTWILALEIVTGVMVGSLFLMALFLAVQRLPRKPSISIPWKKKSSGKDHITICIDPGMLKDVKRYNRQELEVACEDFSNIIGSSSDSLVYKGIMKGGPEIAVISICIKEDQWTGYLELYFQKEVADLARLNHENAGKLLGYCRESSPFTRMLVFEYASNGTLYEHLHYGEGCQLSWTRRMNIVVGIAKGLKYLHTEIVPPFTISEFNSSAVYLTDDFSPKLVDFESWKSIISRSEKNSGAISADGDVCVLPSSIEGRHLDVQGNIYAFGVLLLEIISGRPPYCKEKGCLVDWATEFLEQPEVMSNIVDPQLKHFRLEDLTAICEVVSLCIKQTQMTRVSTRELCSILESRIDTSASSELKASSLAWAELALSS